MKRSVAQKMGIREGMHAFFKNAAEGVQNTLELPALKINSDGAGCLDYIHLFVKTQAELSVLFPAFKPRLEPAGMLWVSWPKGKQLDTDLSLAEVIRIGYNHGLVESTCLSIDTVWSALKFTYPKKG